MKISYELDLDTFEAWSGAVSTLDRIRENNLTRQLENILEELYPDGMSETELNDLLWFDSDSVYRWLGLLTEEMLREKIEEKECEIEDLKFDMEYDIKEAETAEEIVDIRQEYQIEIDELLEEIADLKRELEAI